MGTRCVTAYLVEVEVDALRWELWACLLCAGDSSSSRCGLVAVRAHDEAPCFVNCVIAHEAGVRRPHVCILLYIYIYVLQSTRTLLQHVQRYVARQCVVTAEGENMRHILLEMMPVNCALEAARGAGGCAALSASVLTLRR
eukprot:TRINITY_DN11947_c0_g1_i2.p2 TRINITY_DN11947_c0_g1~~TRINITY_DN11947_c0_g1_i2.p2  ORF type:complete len:141 (-),score=7.11 TRINITY_DN11947_c0_g1_i2:563-985(-)